MTLKGVIANMIDRAVRKPGKPVLENLGRGLSVQIKAGNDSSLTLALRRYGVSPSKREAQIVLGSFPWPATVKDWEMHSDQHGYFYMTGAVTTATGRQLDLFQEGGSDEQPAETTG
jgi:hypothetical protein